MPLESPIVEVLKPSMAGARIVDGVIPENIIPVLELLRCSAVAYCQTGVDMWEITTHDGQHYIRVNQEYVADDEATWRELIGHLLGYAAKKGHESDYCED